MWWWAVAAGAADCSFLVDGVPVERLDCAAGGAWVVRCPMPDEPSGKVRLHASLPARDLVAEAKVSVDPARSSGATVDVPLAGPGGRAGDFVVTRPGAGLLPGQAVGPNQWCPPVQPGVTPGSPRAELPLGVTVAVHRQTGFAEEQMDGGVTNRVPIYDAGQTWASGEVGIVQREVGTVPVTSGPVPTGPRDEPVRGQLSLAGTDGVWHAFSWTGSIVERPVETGDVSILVVDFVASEVTTAVGGDPIPWLQADLARWLARDPTSLLARAAWAKSGFEPAGQVLAFAGPSKKQPWLIASDPRLELRILKVDDRIRVAIAWRAAPWDDAVRREVEEAVSL